MYNFKSGLSLYHTTLYPTTFGHFWPLVYGTPVERFLSSEKFFEPKSKIAEY